MTCPFPRIRVAYNNASFSGLLFLSLCWLFFFSHNLWYLDSLIIQGFFCNLILVYSWSFDKLVLYYKNRTFCTQMTFEKRMRIILFSFSRLGLNWPNLLHSLLILYLSSGLQSAGGHLKELQRALNNPISNVGLILNEGTRRVLKSVGLSSSSVLTEKVAPDLQNWAVLTSKGVDTFGSAVEHLLRKYNKDIIHEQFLLNRLANSAIDIFVMMAVLSRASRAVNKNLPMAQHEVNMASVICSEVCISFIS